MIVIIGALASLDELRSNPEKGQVPLLLNSIGAEDLEKLGKSTLWQPFDIVVTGKDGSITLAKRALQLQ